MIDQILIDVLDKRYFLTTDLDSFMSLYSLDRRSSDTEPRSTEGSSWWYLSEPGTEDSWADSQLIYPPVQALFLFLGNRFIDLLRLESLFPFSVSPPLAGRFIDLLMEIHITEFHHAYETGVSLSFLCLSSSCWKVYSRVRRYSPRFWLLYYASLPDSWDSGFLRLGRPLWLLRTSWLLQVS